LPEKAVYVPALDAVLVSDVHLGKSETFQQCGVPVSSQVNEDTLQRLAGVCDRTQAQQLFILSDLFHSRAGLVDEVIDRWLKFLSQTQVEAHLILGNHDRPLRDCMSQLSLTCQTRPVEVATWILSHEPLPWASGINICGHIHPCVWLGGRGDRLRLPCFYWEHQAHRLILPAFGEFTGGHNVPLNAQVTAYVVADNAVVPFGSVPSAAPS
jgi:DNA ligase-associated metallophosphoesterase